MIEIRDKEARTFPINPMIEMLRRDKFDLEIRPLINR